MAISYQGSSYRGFLQDWQSIMEPQTGIWTFNQVTGPGAPLTRNCGVYIQQDREQIARALHSAYAKLLPRLRYHPVPTYVQERIPLGRGVPWWNQRLRTRWGHVQQFGARAQTLIEADVTVTYSDSDMDGVNDTATISVTTDVAADEVAVFFKVADGAYSAGNERFEVAPLRASAAGGVVTLVAHRALFVKPATFWAVPYAPTDPNHLERNAALTNDATDFVTEVDVYRVYTDTTQAIQIAGDGLSACAPCTSGVVDGCVRVLDYEYGIFEPRVDADFCANLAPQFVIVNYLAGAPRALDGGMELALREALVRLSNVYLPREICAFSDDAAEMWQEDRLIEDLTADMGRGALGVHRGEVYAWRLLRDVAQVGGGAL